MAYGTPPDRMIALRDGLRAFASGHPRVRQDKIEIHIANLGASSVDLLVQVYFGVATYTDEMVLPRRVQPRDPRGRPSGWASRSPSRPRRSTSPGSGAEGHDVPPPPKLLGRERLEAQRPGTSHLTNPAPEP